jgi:hypothetical protein
VWDCDYATWLGTCRDAVPSTPFTLLPATPGENWPERLRVVPQGEGWAIQDASGAYWCDVLTNCWARDPRDDTPVLTFL